MIIPTLVFNRVPAIMAAVEANAELAETAAGKAAADRARAMAPVDSGALRDSIQHDGGEVTAGEGLEYAGYVNFGTRFMPPNPFFSEGAMAGSIEFRDKTGWGGLI